MIKIQSTPLAHENRNSTLHPIAVSPADAARLVGLGRTKIYSAMSEGELKSFKIGKRRLISVQALKEWLHRCEASSTSNL